MTQCLGLAALLALTLNVGCVIPFFRISHEESAGMTWSITRGNERCHLSKLPERFSHLDSGSPYINTPYEIRRNGQSGTQVFIGVAHQAPMGIEAWRSKTYGLDLAASTTAWPVGAAEWDKATVLPLSAEQCPESRWDARRSFAEELQLRGRQPGRCDKQGLSEIRQVGWLSCFFEFAQVAGDELVER
jgi:hypothetical protein